MGIIEYSPDLKTCLFKTLYEFIFQFCILPGKNAKANSAQILVKKAQIKLLMPIIGPLSKLKVKISFELN